MRYRSNEQAYGGAAVGVAIAALGIAGSAGLSLDRALIQAGGCFLIGAALAFLFLRTGLWADQEGIRIQNPLSRSRHRWSEIAGFRIGRHGILRAACIVDLKDGSSTYAFAIQVPNRSLERPDAKERKVIAELKARLEERQRSSDAAVPAA